MKKIFTKFMMLAAAVVVGVSCENSLLDEVAPDVVNDGAVLFVSDLSADTRVSFEDNDDKGLKLAWEESDVFTLYAADGDRVDNFVCTAIGDQIKFESVSSTTELVNDADYTAIYPTSDAVTLDDAKAGVDPSEQNGDKINNLDNSLYMLADFTYSDESEITFEHQMAVMTFRFSADVAPEKLVFENGTDSYTVRYAEIAADANGFFTSHIMINPCEEGSRDLIFSLYAAGATEPYEVRKTSSVKAYQAGQRYTASVSTYAKVNLFSGGKGTEASPYKISTASDLRELSDRVNGYNGYKCNTFSGEFFQVTNDIDLGGINGEEVVAENEFTAIGWYFDDLFIDYWFKGTFDGAGYTISGLYINQPEENNQGLFGYVSGATIKDLTVSGRVTGAYDVGGIVGSCSNSTVVIDCHNKCTVSGSGTTGGVVASNATVTNCHNSGRVSGNKNYTGGVIGETYDEVTDCYNTGTVSGGAWSVGGVVGNAYDFVTRCYNVGSVSGKGSTGGVIGRGDYPMKDCYNTGYVTGSGTAGGVVGKAEAWIANCYNEGEVTGKFVGGVVGVGDASIYGDAVSLCYNTGKITSNSNSCQAGGVIGKSSGSQYKIVNCYNTGDIFINSASAACVGGVAGVSFSNIISCHNTGDITSNFSGSSTSSGNIDIGGVAGNSDVQFSYNTGSINITSSSGASQIFVGGVNGHVSTPVSCYNMGDITVNSSSDTHVGGITGYALDNMDRYCYNMGDIVVSTSSDAKAFAGGLIGALAYPRSNQDDSATFASSYNTGDVTIKNANVAYAGGAAGYVNPYSCITACYNMGNVAVGTASEIYLGGLAGDDCKITSSFYIPYSDASYTNSYGTADENLISVIKSAEVIPTLNAAAGRDFWKADTNNVNDGYPILVNIDYE